MSNTLFATSYMPPISFFVALYREEELNLCSDEYYKKQTYRNRAVILTSQGEQKLSVPVNCKNGNFTSIKDVAICYEKDWRKDHWRSLCTAYNNSPYFLYYKDNVKNILYGQYKTLWELNVEFIKFFISAFGWRKNIIERTQQGGAIIEFSDKNIFNWNRFSIKNANEYRTTFEYKINSIDRLSCCDLLFNYGRDINSFIL